MGEDALIPPLPRGSVRRGKGKAPPPIGEIFQFHRGALIRMIKYVILSTVGRPYDLLDFALRAVSPVKTQNFPIFLIKT